MSSAPPNPGQSHPQEPVGNPDWSPWVLLLIPPILIPLIPGLFNSVEPTLFGMPAFYWMQLAYVPMSAAFTGVVYLKTRKR